MLTKYGLLGLLLFVMFSVSTFGTHFGYTVNGVPQGAAVAEGSPGILGVVDYVFGSLGFLFNMVAFRIDGMPDFVSVIFIAMSIACVVLVVSLIRGTD